MNFDFEDNFGDFADYEDYKTQLKSPEWRKLRKDILKRDNYLCLKCKNVNILNNSIPFLFHSNGTNPLDKSIFFGIFPPLDDIKEFRIPFSIFRKLKERDEYIYYWHQDKGNLHLASIIEIKNPEPPQYVSDSLLEVHHTYYEAGFKAYEYPEDSLQTLCWYCHGEFHKVSNFDNRK